MHQPTRSTRGASSASTCSFAWPCPSAAAMWSMSSSSRCASSSPVCGRMAVHLDAVEVLGRGDEHVGHRARRQVDHEIVDRIARGAFHHVEGQDVGAYRAERHGQRAEAARSILQLDPQQIRRHAQHCRTARAARHFGR